MKKIFSFAAVLFAAMTINAQEPVVVVLNEVANYLDFQAEYIANSEIANVTVTSVDHVTFDNGTELVGYQKSDGTESAMQWNTKEDYNTTCPTPEWEGVDSLTVGTMWRPASGGQIILGEFETYADGKLYVYFQPNGDSSRGVSITYNDNTVEFAKDGTKLGNMRPIYVAAIDITKGYYSAGEIVIKVITNTTNIFGVGIENLGEATTALESVNAAAKATKIVENGQIYILKNGVKFNILGAEVK